MEARPVELSRRNGRMLTEFLSLLFHVIAAILSFLPGLPPVSTQSCPWTAFLLAVKVSLKGADQESQVSQLRKENMGPPTKESSAA